jgi:ribonuclease III
MPEDLKQPEQQTASLTQEGSVTEAGRTFEQGLVRLQQIIGYEFQDVNLLRRALTHRSFANEQSKPRPLHNEALEFLGDAVLEFLVSAWLLELYPAQKEGTLSKLRAFVVSAANLQTHAVRLKLGEYLLLNRGEEKTGGRSKSHLLVDAYEALIAAIYLDGGVESARDFVKREFQATFAEMNPDDLTATDYKTALQESLQSHGLPTPKYAIIEKQGPDHRRTFQVELRVNGKRLATGQGTTIKSAHQDAARAALACLPDEVENLKAAE